MARNKRRLPQQFQEPVVVEDKKKVVYRDDFQKNVGEKVGEFGKQFEGKGKNVLYALGAIAVLAVLFGIFYAWNRRADNAAQTALGKAIETSEAQVTSSPAPNSIGKTFKTDKERAEAAINEFQAVVDKHSGSVEEKAKYFIAVNRLTLDRPAAVQELEALIKSSGEVGTMSKFALAQAKTDDGKLDEAAALYQELAALNNLILAKETVNFELAKIYGKQGKKEEAANLYYDIAKKASEAKDGEGKPIPMSQTARDAKQNLEEINPEKAKEIIEPAPSAPTGMPFGG
ncbi:MAG: tetratricopeptide repeat protein [Pyrinomonadaceae bacterium]